MAKKTVVRVTCDISGRPAHETVRFSLDGVDYEIDLTNAHAKNLRTAFAPYKNASRKVKKPKATQAPKPGVKKPAARSSTTMAKMLGKVALTVHQGGKEAAAEIKKVTSAEIREWARAQGLDVSNSGRIPSSIMEMWDRHQASLAKRA